MTDHMDMDMDMDMDMHDHPVAAGTADPPMTHRMVVFGRDTVFMSHLAMFSMPEHAYQVILQTHLTGSDADPAQAYRDDRAHHPEVPFYTFDPIPFVLPDILPTAHRPAAATSFGGALIRNHIEKKNPPPREIAGAVTVNVDNVVHGRQFDPHAELLTPLTYILFGRGKELFLAHLVTRAPDFDQLLQVTLTPELSADDLGRGLLVTVEGRRNMEGERLQPSEQPSAAIVQTATGPVNVTIDPVAQIYLNFDSDMTDPLPDS